MSPSLCHRLFGADAPLDSVTIGALVVVGGILAVAPLIAWLLFTLGRIDRHLLDDVLRRWRSWLWLVGMMIVPLLLGPVWVMATVALISLLCYQEYARATNLVGERLLYGTVMLGIVAVMSAVVVGDLLLFYAVAVLVPGVITVITIPQDRPAGFLHRTGLAVLGFLLFGHFPGYLGYIANDRDYRPILVLIVLSVELNDVFAFCVGKAIGGPRLLPETSPGKTVAGSVGALVLTTGLVVWLGSLLFAGTPAGQLGTLVFLGALISALGQFGDLLISSIKRDLHIKDMGQTIPGHGGFLDRFDSIMLVAPAVFHYLSWQLGPLGVGQRERVLTGP